MLRLVILPHQEISLVLVRTETMVPEDIKAGNLVERGNKVN